MKIIKKFCDMYYGQWFKEINGNRVFIKIQNILPLGIKLVHSSRVAEDCFYDDGSVMARKGETSGNMFFNAVDGQGVLACCPDWVEFELLESPFGTSPYSAGNIKGLPRHRKDLK